MCELSLLSLVYGSTGEEGKEAIVNKLKEVENVIDGKLKAQGWLSFLNKDTEVVSLDELWKIVGKFEHHPRQKLIEDICRLKFKTNEKEPQ